MSLDGTHMSILKVGKNIIVLSEGKISPYIESVPHLHVNFVEEDIGVYSIFLEEDDNPITQPLDPKDGIFHMHEPPTLNNDHKIFNTLLATNIQAAYLALDQHNMHSSFLFLQC
jgi:hypothetical protein